ncbi:CinA family protein [Alkalithermobacter paradoxus]|uniref:Nicotinamide-nucleotide amidohydrolase PncC n=1 Tax=Alkalithermobacter paradoxus TaxID=29349 RepID=A0A1V4IA93_9FIRM|nr:nicotinamide-nucleotide amidohydrolase PncC [[Clostridium] thermoalcaliphilum]
MIEMENELVKILIDNDFTISIAESCTGGIISSRIVSFPGVSSVFYEGIVTYSNESKMERLNVKKETLDKYGAVSEEVAREMAIGITKNGKVDIGLSVTGIAGPRGKTETKPVGLVYIGLYIKGNVKVKKINLMGDRNKIRNEASNVALSWLKDEVITYISSK